MVYIKQLDSIRTFAVMLVILSHWIPLYYIDLFDLGAIGVNLFFVLSGFLITQILLENKKEAENKNLNKLTVIKNFIIRRSLRIFPIYYLTIFVLFILGSATGTSIRTDFVFYLIYTSNILFFTEQEWDGMLSHLWSLAVEEQFYIIWPWLMVFVSRKYLLSAILLFFSIGVFSNFIIPSDHLYINILTPTCFDAFSLGGILAYSVVFRKDILNYLTKYIPYAALLSFLLFFFSTLFSINIFIPDRTLVAVCALYLIVFAIYNQGSLIHKYILNNEALIFMGKISYGIYLYHNIVPYFWKGLVDKLTESNIQIPLINAYMPDNFGRGIVFIEKFAFLLLVSWLSWKLIEAPINGLKSKFAYKKLLPATQVVKPHVVVKKESVEY